jgi:hypothetical protein
MTERDKEFWVCMAFIGLSLATILLGFAMHYQLHKLFVWLDG